MINLLCLTHVDHDFSSNVLSVLSVWLGACFAFSGYHKDGDLLGIAVLVFDSGMLAAFDRVKFDIDVSG